MSSLVILAASVFEIAERQTPMQTAPRDHRREL